MRGRRLGRSLPALPVVLAAALPLLLLPGQAEAKVVNRIVAKVNEEVITQGDLDRLLRERVQVLQVYEGMTLEQARDAAESEAEARLNELVATTLLEQDARRDEEKDPTLVIDQVMVDQAMTDFRKEQHLEDEAIFTKALDDQGYTLSTFRREMLRSLRIRELFRRRIFPRLNVTAEEVTAYYEAHREDFESADAARDHVRELRFAEERERMISALRDEAFVQVLVTF